MSIRLMSDVWRTDLPTIEKMVLLVIADHANDEGTQSYPSQATIAHKASISIRTVQRSVNSLVIDGYIRMFKGAGGSANCRNDRRPHLYAININKLRIDNVTSRDLRGDIENIDGATITPLTGRQSRPMNHPKEPSLETPLFIDFWKAYPIKVGKGAAVKAFEKALRIVDADTIIKGAIRYSQDPNRVPGYTAHAATWLNAQRWLDEALPQRNLSIEEKRKQELLESKAKSEKEKAEATEWFKQQDEAKKQAVPLRTELRNLIQQISAK